MFYRRNAMKDYKKNVQNREKIAPVAVNYCKKNR